MHLTTKDIDAGLSPFRLSVRPEVLQWYEAVAETALRNSRTPDSAKVLWQELLITLHDKSNQQVLANGKTLADYAPAKRVQNGGSQKFITWLLGLAPSSLAVKKAILRCAYRRLHTNVPDHNPTKHKQLAADLRHNVGTVQQELSGDILAELGIVYVIDEFLP